MAWVMARIWASVNVARSGEPRWPLVPKLTNWVRSFKSGARAWYSSSSRVTSTSSFFGAGWPARGDTVERTPTALDMVPLSRCPRRIRLRCDRLKTCRNWLHSRWLFGPTDRDCHTLDRAVRAPGHSSLGLPGACRNLRGSEACRAEDQKRRAHSG